MLLRDIITNDVTGKRGLYKMKSDTYLSSNGYIEIMVEDIDYDHKLAKLRYLTTLKTHKDQDMIEWVGFDQLSKYDLIKFFDGTVMVID